MNIHQHHEELVDGAFEQLKPIFDNSNQAVYLYLNDIHKVCNKKFASFLGFKSPKEWAGVEDILDKTVSKKSQKTLVVTYRKAMEDFTGSVVNVTWKKKNGDEVSTKVILVPMIFNAHRFALHFVSE